MAESGIDGICKIKSEFVITIDENTESLVASENDKKPLNDEPEAKKRKLSKYKKRFKSKSCTSSQELCNSRINILEGQEIPKCENKNCYRMHDFQEYLKIKPKDISTTCYNFETTGKCNRGLTCRFALHHTTPDGFNKIDVDKSRLFEENGEQTINKFDFKLQILLKKRQYKFDLSERLVKFNDKLKPKTENEQNETNGIKTCGSVTDEDLIKLKQREKPSVNWKNKLFLSSLTTVGNLPFRRICKEYGADVTCGEMAMCNSLLQGKPQEWALIKRHRTEDIFGVQLCANNPYLLTKCGELLNERAEVDFVELNLGCPIELVYESGAGCGLLNRPRCLESCITNLSDIINVPLTVKTRTGVYSKKRVADNFIPKFKSWGASLVTLHGRSREQRYTKLADWEYIGQCAKDAAPFPVVGNGDILSYDDYKRVIDTYPELYGVMIGRGALIKPWIFTEIKEGKLWDVRSNERFDMLKKYTNYGLEHWGSDDKGVENTRRFMLEWLSFLYRYVPVGLLETPPQKINERPPSYRGRDDLETLMASTYAGDWIKITEMLLGPVADDFHFIPKHKANSYR